jgi:hypothetical protein
MPAFSSIAFGWVTDLTTLQEATAVWQVVKGASTALRMIAMRKERGALATSNMRCSVAQVPFEVLDLIDASLLQMATERAKSYPSTWCACCAEPMELSQELCSEHIDEYLSYDSENEEAFGNPFPDTPHCKKCSEARRKAHDECDYCVEAAMDARYDGVSSRRAPRDI